MAKLGTSDRPAVLRARTEERAVELLDICDSRGWKAIIGVEPDQPEDTSDLESLLFRPRVMPKPIQPARNAACPCGSDRKYKSCCERRRGRAG